MQGRITKEFVMRPYVFTTQLRRIIIMKKRLIAVLMCVPEMAWAEASSVRVDAQEVPVNGNWYEYKI